MRLLHTSDWHLGRSFHREGLIEAQAAYVDHLVEVVRAERVDAVLVAGDVYDRALPPLDAVEVADAAFARLADLGVRVVVTSGNHDSPVRLGAHSALADAAGVHLRTRWQRVGEPVLLEDRHGPVAVHGLPYLEPDAVRAAWELPTRSHEAALRAAMDRVHADLRTRPGVRSVVMAHAFVAGLADRPDDLRSDSERDLSVGGVQVAPVSLFDAVDYTALGHLHAPRALTDSIRYSGSPLAYSFSEAEQVKGSWLVELEAPGEPARATFVEAPVPRRLATLRGRLEHLLTDPGLAAYEDHWLQVVLTDARRPDHAMHRLQTRFPHTLLLDFQPEQRTPRTGPVLPRLTGRSDLDVALGFVEEVRQVEATTEEELLLQLACDACRVAEAADPLPGATGPDRAAG